MGVTFAWFGISNVFIAALWLSSSQNFVAYLLVAKSAGIVIHWHEAAWAILSENRVIPHLFPLEAGRSVLKGQIWLPQPVSFAAVVLGCQSVKGVHQDVFHMWIHLLLSLQATHNKQ